MGLVHRDIKPENAMVSGGRALLIDFGFAAQVRPSVPPAEGPQSSPRPLPYPASPCIPLSPALLSPLLLLRLSCLSPAPNARRLQAGAGGCAPRARGELRYMEARDLRALRGCERGDGLALGRTLAEVAFGYEGQAAEKDPARMQALENALDWRDVAGCACSPPPPAAKSRVRAPGTFVAADGREGRGPCCDVRRGRQVQRAPPRCARGAAESRALCVLA